MTTEHVIGHIAGVTAVLFFVLLKSVLWYAIPPIIRKVDGKAIAVRTDSKYHRKIHITGIVASILALAVSMYFLDFSTMMVYALILSTLMLIIVFQETTRLAESVQEAGFNSVEEVLEELTQEDTKEDSKH